MKSVRKRVALFMGVTSVLVLLSGVVVTVIHYGGKVRQQNSTELASFARTAPSLLQALGANLTLQGQALTTSEDFHHFIRIQQHQALFVYLARFLITHHLDFAEVTDPSALVLLNLADSLAQGKPTVNPLVRSTLTGESVGQGILRMHDQIYFVVTLPIQEGSRTLGAITLGETFNQDLMQRLSSMPGIGLAIWKDPDRAALVPLGHDPLPSISELLDKDEISHIVAGGTLVRTIKFDGNALQCAFFTLGELGGQRLNVCAAYRSMSFLKEAGWLTLLHSAVLFLLVMILVVQFAWWMSKRVSEPLAELSGVANRMADLNFSQEVPVKGDDEIGELTLSFNKVIHTFKENIEKKDSYAAELAELNEKLERAVAQRTEELEHINLRLKREMAEKNEFLRAVSHDLGAPMRNIAGLARTLEKKYADRLDEEGRDKLHRICNNITHEQEMIEQLLELSRIMTRPGRETEINLMDLLGQIRQDLSYSIEEKGIRLVVLEVLPTIVADKDRIRRLFLNLIDNASKYMGDQEHPEIEIGWSKETNWHLFWVSDNGMGIPADQRDKIFGIFQRVKSKEVSAVAGKGVGLASVKTIVESYGGDVWVESEPDGGSTFYFTLDHSLVDSEERHEAVEEVEGEDAWAEDYATDSVD